MGKHRGCLGWWVECVCWAHRSAQNKEQGAGVFQDGSGEASLVLLFCASRFLHEQRLLCFFIRLSRVAEETIKDYFEARLALLEPVFPIACHRLCEGPDFSMDFNYRPPQTIPEGKPCFSPTLKCDILNINNLFFEENLNKLHHVY